MKSVNVNINTGERPYLADEAELTFSSSADESRKKWQENLQKAAELERQRQREAIERLSIQLMKQISKP